MGEHLRLEQDCGHRGEIREEGKPPLHRRETRRKGTDKDGNERFTTEIRADGIQLLGKREEAKPAPAEESPALKALKAEDNPEQDLPF